MPQYANSAPVNPAPANTRPAAGPVANTPVEQFNPFATMPAAPAKPVKKSSGRTLDLLLGLLSILFIVAAAIFFILWQQAKDNIKVIPVPTDPTQSETPSDPEPEAPAEPVVRHLSCRGAAEVSDIDRAAGLVSSSSLYEVYYPEGSLTEIHVVFTAEYDSAEAAAAAAATASNETVAYLQGIYASMGIELTIDDLVTDGNTVTMTVVIPADKLTNPEADIFTRQMLAAAISFPSEISADNTVLTVYTDIDSVRTNYEANGFVCEVIE